MTDIVLFNWRTPPKERKGAGILLSLTGKEVQLQLQQRNIFYHWLIWCLPEIFCYENNPWWLVYCQSGWDIYFCFNNQLAYSNHIFLSVYQLTPRLTINSGFSRNWQFYRVCIYRVSGAVGVKSKKLDLLVSFEISLNCLSDAVAACCHSQHLLCQLGTSLWFVCGAKIH